MTRIPLPPVDVERLGFAIAANAERHLFGPVVEQYRVTMHDHTGKVHGSQLAADQDAANAIAAAWRTAGWHTTTSPVCSIGGA